MHTNSSDGHNPLVAALGPLPQDIKAFNRLIQRLPTPPTEQERDAPMPQRYEAVRSLEQQVYIPGARDLKMAMDLQTMIVAGYKTRQANARYWQQHQQTCRALPNLLSEVHGPTLIGDPMALIGGSGSGKSTLINNMLSTIPQVHTHTADDPLLPRHQINWLKINCPVNGTPRSFLTAFFSELDRLLGTKLVEKNKRINDDERIVILGRLARTYFLGVLVIDEIQHLVSAPKRDERRLLKLIVNLSATLGVPLLFVGTFKAQDMISRELADARRMLGPRWLPYAADDADWLRFLEKLWVYQYTRVFTPLTPTLRSKVHDLSQGIPALAKKLFCLTQEFLIYNGNGINPENITAEILQSVFDENMAVVAPAIEALRSGRGIDRINDLPSMAPIGDHAEWLLDEKRVHLVRNVHDTTLIQQTKRIARAKATMACKALG